MKIALYFPASVRTHSKEAILRVLLVEDQPDRAEVVRKGLVEEGYAVDLSEDFRDRLISFRHGGA
jgi:CheY-like chemotaxis protein